MVMLSMTTSSSGRSRPSVGSEPSLSTIARESAS
jgi:hypothetical protein